MGIFQLESRTVTVADKRLSYCKWSKADDGSPRQYASLLSRATNDTKSDAFVTGTVNYLVTSFNARSRSFHNSSIGRPSSSLRITHFRRRISRHYLSNAQPCINTCRPWSVGRGRQHEEGSAREEEAHSRS